MFRRPPSITTLAAVLAILTGLATWAVAESLYVQKNATPLLSGPDGSYDPIGPELKKGDKIDVLERDGDWVKVTASGRTGWIYSGNLSPDKPGGSLADIFGGSGTSGQTNTAAASGLLPEAEKVAAAKHLRTEDLKRMERNRKRITPEMLKSFQKEGHVGRYADAGAKGGAK